MSDNETWRQYAAKLRPSPVRLHEKPELLEQNRLTLQAARSMRRAVAQGTVVVQFSQRHVDGTTPGGATEKDITSAEPLDIEVVFVVPSPDGGDQADVSFRFNLRDAFMRDRDPDHGTDLFGDTLSDFFDWRPIATALEQLAFEMRRVSEDGEGA